MLQVSLLGLCLLRQPPSLSPSHPFGLLAGFDFWYNDFRESQKNQPGFTLSLPDESTRRSVNHAAVARVGAGLGGISIAFSTLCFLVMPAFTPAFMLAALFGSLSGAIALALKARRTAMVAFAFALAPFVGFLLMEYAAEPLRNGYVVFVPLGLAAAMAVWSFLNYSKARRLKTGAAA